MFRNNWKILFPFMLFFSLLVACSPSAKNELKYWENHKTAATEHSTKYPAFKAVVDANLKEATPVATKAIALKDEKKKAEELQKANKIAQDGVIGRMTELNGKIESLEKKIEKLGKLKLTKDKSKKRKKAMTAAREEITKVNTAMAEAKPTNKEEALAVLKTQIDAMISAQGSADRVYNSVKPKSKKKKKKKKKKKN